MSDPESTTTGGSKWVRTVSTTGYFPIPADGDNYAYTPPVTEYQELLGRSVKITMRSGTTIEFQVEELTTDEIERVASELDEVAKWIRGEE